MPNRILLSLAALVAVLTACLPVPATTPAPVASDTPIPASPTVPPPTPTTTLVPEPLPPSPTATQPAASEPQFIAFIREGQLLVTDVTNNVQGGTTQYTLAGESDQVMDLVWSPNGEFVAFVSAASGEPHLFYVFALGQSTPVDLGPGSVPAWSPDSQSIAYVRGPFPDDNIWVTTIEVPSPRQLTFQSNYAWGRPAFTPDGTALVVAGADRNNMGAQGNTSFTLEQLALDGSGTRSPLPGAAPLDGSRLPYDLQFSPDGARLAFSSSYHWSACASPGAYYITQPDGSNRQELVSPSLQPVIDPDEERFHVGLSYGWSPASDALVVIGAVLDCAFDSPRPSQPLAGPQISILGLDGSERLVIPGIFYNPGMDRTGTLIAATHYQSSEDLNPMVEIYSAQNGQLVLQVGPGNYPQLQP